MTNTRIVEELSVNHEKLIKTFSVYIWFALLFYVVSFFGGGGVKFREGLNWYILISRDVVWLVFIIYMGYSIKWAFLSRELWRSEYGSFLKKFILLSIIYLLIVTPHVSHRGIADVLHHDVRNILSYSLILFFLPYIILEQKDVYSLINTFLKAGIVLSLFGIATRYVDMDFLTWRGRIVSTMSDPNNLGIFLVFCIVILVANWDPKKLFKSTALFLLYSYALMLTTSATAFFTVIPALFVILVLRNRFIKGVAIFILIFYTFISLSLLSKIIENVDKINRNLFLSTYNTEKYMIDKVDVISKGLFSKFILFGTNLPSSSGSIRSVTYREAQLDALISNQNNSVKELDEAKNIISIFGDFYLKEYATFDHQYMNFIVNSGIISALIFFGLFTWGGISGLINYFHFKKCNKKLTLIILSLSVFILSMTWIAFNGSAFLNRFPLNFIMYFSLGMIFMIQAKLSEG